MSEFAICNYPLFLFICKINNLRNPTHCLYMQARDASLQNFKAPLYHSSATFFSIIMTNFWFWVQKGSHEVGSSCKSAVTNNEAIDGSIAKLFSNCAIVKKALVTSSYESFTVTNSLNVFITARRRRRCSSKRTSKHNHIQWNPVNTETKGTCFTSRFIRSGI